jgi:hypothetical protein
MAHKYEQCGLTIANNIDDEGDYFGMDLGYDWYDIYCILVFSFASCGVSKKGTSPDECTLESAIDKAKTRLKRKGFQLEHFNVNYAKQEKAFLIVFSLIEISEGGGAEITISRDNCEIIDEKFWQ